VLGSDPVSDGHLIRVLHEFVQPALAGSVAPLDEIAAHHVAGEPISIDAALAAPFEPFELGGRWGPRWDTTWFRLRGHIPEEWSEREVALRFEVGAAGSTGFGAEALVWRNGQPVQGLSPNHVECRVASRARGGEAVELFVEAAANPRPPFGASTWPVLDADPGGPGQFRLATAELRLVDPALRSFGQDLRVCLDALLALDPAEPARAELRSTLLDAARALDLADVAGTYGAAQPILEAALEVSPPRGAHRISAVGHAHLDTAWLWPLRETVRKCARTFSTALRLMDDYPEYRFACSQAVHLAWMRDRYPSVWAAIRGKVAAGQFEPTGSMWVEPDCNVPSGESLVRQLVYGKRFYLDEFGIEARGAWLPDTFGFSGALPQILRQAGVEWFLSQKLSWNQYNQLPHHSFLWEGIDGSRIFTHFPPSDTYCGAATAKELLDSVRHFKDHAIAHRSLYPFGHGDGGGGPDADMLESLRRLPRLAGLPEVALEGPDAFFAAAAHESDHWPVWVGELYLELHRGTYTTHADVKLANRRGELRLRDAELWATAAHPTGDGYPHGRLEQAWKTLLVHQFHDIIPGSGIGWVYEDAARDHADVLATADQVVADATARLVAEVDTDATRRPVIVFNAASHDRASLVTLDLDPHDAAGLTAHGPGDDRSPVQVTADGSVVASVRVPACGYARYDLVPGSAPAQATLDVDRDHLENDCVRVTFDRDGLVTSIVDKRAEREVVAAGARANLFQLHPDHPNFFDAWDIDRFAFDQATDLVALDEVEVVEQGPLRVGLRMVRHFGSSRIDQLVSLEAGTARLEFHTEVDWHESHQLLKVAFPVEIHAPAATYEIQFGHLQRPTHASTSWDFAKFEVCAQQWADLSEGDYGVALLNDCKYGYDIQGNVLRLSLLRAPTWPDPTADRGRHRFTYALLPHAGDLRAGRVVEEARELNLPLEAIPATPRRAPRPPSASLVRVDQPGVLVEAVKRADRSPGIIVRLAEVWGRRTSVHVELWDAATLAVRTDLLERDQAPIPITDGNLALQLRPFELVTARVELAD
jgi:alpha-mannosidase